MYRLKFRKTGAGIGALIVGAVVILCLPFNAATNSTSVIFDLPLLPILAAQFVLPIAFALFTYRACPFIQQIRALLVTASFIGFFGCLANSNGGPTGTAFQIMSQDWLLHFNAVAIGVMNMAAFIAAINLMHSEQMSSFADTQVAEAQLERLKAVKVDPDTQAKWEKAAAYADRSADGRSLRSTMTNLKAISLTEPGQELKPQMRETPAEKTKDKASARNADEGSLANLLDRMDDEPLPGQEMSQAKVDPALEGNSFINDSDTFSATASHANYSDSDLDALEPAADFNEPFVDKFADTPSEYSNQTYEEPAAATDFSSASSGFLDNMLDSKIAQTEEAAPYTPPSSPSFSGLEQLPVEDNEAADVAALLDAFDENQGEPQIAEVAEPPAFVAEIEAPPAVETTKTSSFAKASSSRIPAMQPVEPVVDATANSAVSSTAAGASATTAPSANVPSAFTTSAPGNTNNKLAAMKRRNTSTFTKLNALSASGSGQLMPTPQAPSGEGNEPDSLRSLLDRLDDDEPAAEPQAKAHEPAKPIEPPFEITLDTVFKGDGTPEVAATPTTIAKPKAAEPTPVVAREPEPEPEPEPVLAAPEIVEEVIEEVVEEAPQESALNLFEEESEEGENVFGDSDAVNLDVDKAFADLAPPEAQLDVSARALQNQADEDAEREAQQAAQEQVEEVSEEVEAEAELEEEGSGGNLFEGGVDNEIDRVFEDLAPPEAQKEVKDVLAAKVAEPVQEAAPEVTPEAAQEENEESGEEGGLFGEDLGEELDKVFSDLTEGEQLEVNASTLAKVKGADGTEVTAAPARAPEPVVAPAPASAPVEKPAAAAAASTEGLPAGAKTAPAKYKEVKEFGRLSSKAPVVKTGGETSGTMKTIGKLLLDVQAVENIIKSGENRKIGSGLSTAKIISAARGEGIKNILTTIDTYEGVAGSLIVGHDGLVIASTVGTGWDKDMLGALSTALLSTSNLATKKLEIGKLRQMVMMTELTNGDGQKFKTTVLTDVDVGILAVFLEKTDLQKIDGLLDTIQSSIHGG